MPNNESQLSIVIKARDEATKALQNVSAELNKLSNSARTASGQVNAEMRGMDSMFTGLGRSALQLAATFGVVFSAGAIINFFKSSAAAAVDSQAKWDLVASRIQSSGIAWEEARGTVQKFAADLQKMGRDDEETGLAVAMLTQKTGDLNRAMQLTKAASDLAASGYGTLADNADALGKVLSGRGSFALRQYGIKLDENASISEQLDAIMGKITRTTEQWGQTTEGQIATASAQWADFKENVGAILTPTLTSMLGAFNSVIGASNEAGQSVAKVWGIELNEIFKKNLLVVREIADVLLGISRLDFRGLAGNLKDAFGSLKNLNFKQAAADIVGVDLNKFKVQWDALSLASDKAKESIDSTTTDMKDWKSPFEETGTIEKVNEMREAFEKLGMDGSKALFDLAYDSEQAVLQLNKDLESLDEKYRKTSDSGAKSLSDLQKQSKERLDGITESIRGVQKQMEDLQKQFDKTKQSDIRGLADSFAGADQKIKDLKEQLKSATDVDQIFDIKSQIREQEDALSKTKDVQEQYAAEIAQAKERAGMSEVERAILDFNEKRELAQQDFNDQMALYQAEIAALEEKRTAEKRATAERRAEIKQQTEEALAAILKEKIETLTKYKEDLELRIAQEAQITKVMQEAQAMRTAATVAGVNSNVEQIEREIKQYQRLAAAISAAASARYVGGVGGVTPYSTPRAGFDTGGYVQRSGMYMLHQGEYINTPQDSRGARSIEVNINGGTYLSEDAAEMMGNLIIDKLKSNMRI